LADEAAIAQPGQAQAADYHANKEEAKAPPGPADAADGWCAWGQDETAVPPPQAQEAGRGL